MIEFKAALLDYANRLSIVAVMRDAYGQMTRIAQPVELTMVERQPHDMIERGTLELDDRSAQSLMNALWEAGLRPTDFKSPNGEINRMEAHLADMRRLVFDRSPPQSSEGK